MQQISGDGDQFAFQGSQSGASEVGQHRVSVQKGLGRVLMGAVPGVDHTGPHPSRGLGHRSGARVAHHDGVHSHSVQGHEGVAHRFALRDA